MACRTRTVVIATPRLAILSLALVVSHGAACAGPERIASINLCTDQHLLSMAEPSRIVGLSPFARDAARAWLAKQAADYPRLSGMAEDVLVLAPDLVVAGRWTRRQTREQLRAHGVRVEEFDPVESIADVKEQIARFGALIGASAAAARQVAAIDAAVARARAAAAQTPATVLALQRRGWVSGERSLTTSLLDAVGLRNAAAVAGHRDGKLMTLESVVAMQPDLLLVTRADSSAEDQGRAMLLHPAIARDRMIVIPEMLTVCGGAMLVEALDRLSEQIARLRLK